MGKKGSNSRKRRTLREIIAEQDQEIQLAELEAAEGGFKGSKGTGQKGQGGREA